MRPLIGAIKLFIFLLSAIFTITYQSMVLFFTKGPFAYIYPRAYHAFLCRLFGIKILIEGEIEEGPNLVYAGNHISYLDIEAVGSIVKGTFVAKKEVRDWPLFGILGSMQQTLYISRSPNDAQKATNVLLNKLAEGMPLIIFAEGTSSDGTDILPFKSSFFEILLNRDFKIQPFTISVMEVDGQKASTSKIRNRYTWHGDMTLEPHLWWFAKSKGAILKIAFQKPISSMDYNNRKLLSKATHDAVAKGLDLSVMDQ